jgi:hypothetical protein
MNLSTIYTHVRAIAGETAWILEKMEEYEREATETHARFAEARTLVTGLDTAARRVLPLELQTLWNTLGALAAVDPLVPVNVMPDPTRSARRIVDIMYGAAHPIISASLASFENARASVGVRVSCLQSNLQANGDWLQVSGPSNEGRSRSIFLVRCVLPIFGDGNPSCE